MGFLVGRLIFYYGKGLADNGVNGFLSLVYVASMPASWLWNFGFGWTGEHGEKEFTFI